MNHSTSGYIRPTSANAAQMTDAAYYRALSALEIYKCGPDKRVALLGVPFDGKGLAVRVCGNAVCTTYTLTADDVASLESLASWCRGHDAAWAIHPPRLMALHNKALAWFDRLSEYTRPDWANGYRRAPLPPSFKNRHGLTAIPGGM